MSKKKLVLLTQNFPYFPGEQFLETEIKYLSESFNEVHIIPVSVSDHSGQRRNLPQNVTVHPLPNSKYPIVRAIQRMNHFVLDNQAKRWFEKDKRRANSMGKSATISLMNWLGISVRIRKFVKNRFFQAKTSSENDYLFYSYWLNPAAMALSMLKEQYPNITIVSRAHGGDVYEYRHNPQYLPLQSEMIEKLNRLFVISEDGRQYLLEKNKGQEEKLSVSRLGTRKVEASATPSNDSLFRLVSCSYIKPVKRLDLLVEALKLCKSNIEWRHIGDGPLLEKIAEQTKELPSRITCSFLVNMKNDEIINNYVSEPADVFINVSESEGVPVTIMEAFSCAIPVIATDVGGTAELVNETNGLLLNKDISAEELAKAIDEMASLQNEKMKNMREVALNTWENLCDADKNYQGFVSELLMIKENNNNGQ